jgi:hypothetical protein
VAEAAELMRQVLHAAATSGHLNNTLVVVTSDHGEMSLEHRMDLKSSLYEASARVPLVVIPYGVEGVRSTRAAGRLPCHSPGHPPPPPSYLIPLPPPPTPPTTTTT